MHNRDYQGFLNLLADQEPMFIPYDLKNLPPLTMDQVSLAMIDEPDRFHVRMEIIRAAACIALSEESAHGSAMELMDMYKSEIIPAVRVKVLEDLMAELSRREMAEEQTA